MGKDIEGPKAFQNNCLIFHRSGLCEIINSTITVARPKETGTCDLLSWDLNVQINVKCMFHGLHQSPQWLKG